MTEADPHRDLLERATVALEGIERTAARQAKAFDRQAESFDRQAKSFDRQEAALERMMQRLDEDRVEARSEREEARAHRVEARAQHEQMMRRFERSESLFVAAISKVGKDIQRNSDRLEDIGVAIRDMRDSIRANTQAVLSVLDRLGPATG